MRVAIFDSGTGGLSIFSKFINTFPWVDTCYLGDVRYFPYGTKDTNELLVIIERIISFFSHNQFDYVLIACNTASIIYDRYLRDRYKHFVFDVIKSTADEAYYTSPGKNIGVIGTEYTIQSNIYERQIHHIDPTCNIVSLACSELVEMCEQENAAKINRYIENHFCMFKESGIDTFILGCTHYNVLYHKINEFFKFEVNIISSGFAMVKKMTFEHETVFNKGKHTIYTTGNQMKFESKKNRLYPELKDIPVHRLKL